MAIRSVLSALLTTVVLATSASAQTPPPKTEAELVASGHKKLSGQQIAAKLVGNTTYVLFLAPFRGAQAGSQVIIFYRDAKVRVSVPTGGPFSGKKIESNWWIEGNLYCVEQRIVGAGHECFSQIEVGSAVYVCTQPAGECIFLSRIVPGNPDKI